jgi:hypothetical protein
MIAHRDPEGLRVEGPFGRRGITAGLSGPARRRPLSLNVMPSSDQKRRFRWER